MQEIKFIVIIMLACIMSICGFAQNNEPKLNESDEHITSVPLKLGQIKN